MDARQFLAALPPEQQRAYLRNVYYAELKASGREFNDAMGPRAGSYLRGREAIATLFPGQAADGQGDYQGNYQGDLTMFSSARFYQSGQGQPGWALHHAPQAGHDLPEQGRVAGCGQPRRRAVLRRARRRHPHRLRR